MHPSHFATYANASQPVSPKFALWALKFVSAVPIHTSSTQSQQKCERFLSRCKTMLEPGKGVLFGYCVGTTEPEGVTWAARPSPDVVENELHTRFLHSATSLQQVRG